jgi:haloalkane dehalogenase
LGNSRPVQQTHIQKKIPEAQNRELATIKNAGHFLQEDKGEELVQVILDFIRESA